MAEQAKGSAAASTTANGKVNEMLDQARAASQQLHGAISDAAAQQSADMKAALAKIPGKAKAVADSVTSAMSTTDEAVKKQLADAVTHLKATQTNLSDSLKTSGQSFQSSVMQALTDARAAVQKISEAVATQRSAHPVAAAAIEVGIGAALIGRAAARRSAQPKA